METIDFIKEIETRYNVDSITVDGFQVWPIVRQAYIYQFDTARLLGKPSRPANLLRKPRLRQLGNVVYGFSHWFKQHDYCFFSTTDNRALLHGHYIDIRSAWLRSELGNDRSVIIENPGPGSIFPVDR